MRAFRAPCALIVFNNSFWLFRDLCLILVVLATLLVLVVLVGKVIMPRVELNILMPFR